VFFLETEYVGVTVFSHKMQCVLVDRVTNGKFNIMDIPMCVICLEYLLIPEGARSTRVHCIHQNLKRI